jgi:glucose-6-phosphate isomerase
MALGTEGAAEGERVGERGWSFFPSWESVQVRRSEQGQVGSLASIKPSASINENGLTLLVLLAGSP